MAYPAPDAIRQLKKLAEKVGGQSALAREVGRTKGTISNIIAGRVRPSPELVERFAALGLPAEAWGAPMIREAPTSTAPATPRAPRPKLSLDASSVARLEESLRDIEQRLDEEPGASLLTDLLKLRASTLVQIARLRGEGEITAAMVYKSAVWREIIHALEETLVPFPEAARAVREAFQALEGK